jgi:cytochrome c oxidase subunit 2
MTGLRFHAVALAAAIGTAITVAACNGGDGKTRSEGEQLFNSQGCVACHGAGGAGAMGPALAGVYLDDVQLADGSTVVADEAYLRLAITDPAAQQVDGYLEMPANNLTAEQVQAIVDWIKTLG